MAWKLRYNILLVWTIVLLLFFSLLFINVINLPNSTDNCKCPAVISSKSRQDNSNRNNETSHEHKLALIIPYRERFEELQEFLPHMRTFLDKQDISHDIFIINQVDNYRFNRAALINVGFHFIRNLTYDYIAMHDVDLLPANPELRYDFPGQGKALHLASPKFHPRYNYTTFVGGILLLTKEDFAKLNGMSNRYWGWGLEDDEFYVRMKEGGIVVTRPDHITTGRHDTFRHIHNAKKRVRDRERCFNQREVSRIRDRVTGLDNVAYKISSVVNVSVESATATILNVELECDKNSTPWCSCSEKHKRKSRA
nr:EOG090X0AZ6 [Eulimnadia texana]